MEEPTMKSNLQICGYLLESKGIRLRWADAPYEGYDRDKFFEASFRFDEPQDSEMWRLQMAALPGQPYFTSLDEILDLRARFAKCGKDLDLIAVWVATAGMSNPADLPLLPAADEPRGVEYEGLGFDVGWLLGQHSIIYEPGFMTKCDQVTRELWASRLNEHGLFDSEDNALRFRDLFYQQPELERESGHMELLWIALVR